MILTTKAKYAVIAVIDMMEDAGGRPISLAAISQRQKISLSFLEQIFSALKKAKIVKSVKGPGGGYFLAGQNFNISDIIAAVNEPIKMTRCAGESGCVDKKIRCKTHKIWRQLEDNIHQYLSSISLAEVSNRHNQEENYAK